MTMSGALRQRPRWLAGVGLFSVFGCGSSSGSEGDEASSSSTTDPDTTSDDGSESSSSSQETESSTGPSETSSSTGESPAPSCGDANVDPGEMCDDGNVEDGDGCDFDCTPSDPAQWSYVGGPLTSLRALTVGADGSILAGGTFGNPWDFGSLQALLRGLDADGNPVAEVDMIVPGESYVFDVGHGEDGRYWLFGARVVNAWIHRIDDRESDQLNYAEIESWVSATFADDGIAASSFVEVAWLDVETGDVVWKVPIGEIDDSTIAANGDVLVVGRAQFGDPTELRRFAPDGSEQGTPVALDAMSYCAVAASAIGTAVVGLVDPNTLESELRVFDDDGALVFASPLPGSQYFAVTATDEVIVLSGGVIGDGSLTPAATAFAPDGTESWTFMPDPADYGLQGGYLADAELTPDGAFVFAGTLQDLAADPFEPPGHAFVIRRPS